MKNYHLPLFTFIVGALLGFGASSLFSPSSLPTTEQTKTDFTKLRSGSSVPLSDTTERYKNEFYGFSLEHPKGMGVQQYNEAGDSSTIVFQVEGEEKGFQIYIVPYTAPQISKEQIQRDLQGAPMKKVMDIVLSGGIPAVHFESQAPVIGESTEVWFIHNGYLYEVTTYKAHDAWLAGILATLTFTK